MVQKHGRNRAALEESIKALASGPECRMLEQAARSLADAVDSWASEDDKVWREYRFALRALMEATSGGGSDDFTEELRKMRAEMGHPEVS